MEMELFGPGGEPMYCSQQIHVPLNLPWILKQYAKAAIRTQPKDLLYWSAVYFRALAEGQIPPVKERIEYPPINTPSGLSPGFLKILIKQIGKQGLIQEDELALRWKGVGLSEDALVEMIRLTGGGNADHMAAGKVRWLNFIAVAAGYLCPSLTQTMILICELLTDEPDGGSATIALDTFLTLYKFLARTDCGPVVAKDTNDVVLMEICATRTSSMASISATDVKEQTTQLKTLSEIDHELHMPPADPQAEGKDSTEGLMVWHDIPQEHRSGSPQPSDEGAVSEQGLAVLDHETEPAQTPGYKKPSTVEVPPLLKKKDPELVEKGDVISSEIDLEEAGSHVGISLDVELEDHAKDSKMKTAEAVVAEILVAADAMVSAKKKKKAEKKVKDKTGEEEGEEEEEAEEEEEPITDIEPRLDVGDDLPEEEEEQEEVVSEEERPVVEVAEDEVEGLDAEGEGDEEAEPEVGEPLPKDWKRSSSEEDATLRGKVKDTVTKQEVMDLFKDAPSPSSDTILSITSEPALDVGWIHVPGIGPVISEEQILLVVQYMNHWAAKQCGYVMPRNMRHFLCPPLDCQEHPGYNSTIKSSLEVPL